MKQPRQPIVAIVGRANVGKSSLFNAILGRREAIVAREPGTTRDNVTAKASIGNKDFWLVDTAGLKSAEDDFELSIQEQITEAAASADLILVVVGADVAPTSEDRRVAKLALKSQKPVVLVINKIDQAKRAEPRIWLRLGIKNVIPTSATQKEGISELAERLSGWLPTVTISEASDRIRIAIVGRPNVGKSSLFNTIIKKQRAVVAAEAGTTRDVNRDAVRYHNREIEFLDTGGIRRSGKIEAGAEKFSVLRALAAIEEADIGLLVMDASELNVQLDQKIAGLIAEAGKGLILVVSKWDAVDKEAVSKASAATEISGSFVFVPWAPLVFTSAETGENVSKILEIALQIDAARRQKFSTAELNKWLKQATDQHPPAGLKNRQPQLSQVIQEGVDWPNFKIFGEQTRYLHWSYKRYLDRSFRQIWPLAGTPIKFWFIEKD